MERALEVLDETKMDASRLVASRVDETIVDSSRLVASRVDETKVDASTLDRAAVRATAAAMGWRSGGLGWEGGVHVRGSCVATAPEMSGNVPLLVALRAPV